MEKSSFFNSISGDRRYKAEEWAEYFASFIANGVFPNPSTGLQVLASNSMIITVNTGKAWINGYFYFNTSNLTITLDNADGVLNRIDRIVVRWDLQDRVYSRCGWICGIDALFHLHANHAILEIPTHHNAINAV